MLKDLKTNIELLEGPQEIFEILADRINRAILIFLREKGTAGSTLEELRKELRTRFEIHESYIDEHRLKKLQKCGLIRLLAVNLKMLHSKPEQITIQYHLSSTGNPVADIVRQLMQQFSPLDMIEISQAI